MFYRYLPQDVLEKLYPLPPPPRIIPPTPIKAPHPVEPKPAPGPQIQKEDLTRSSKRVKVVDN